MADAAESQRIHYVAPPTVAKFHRSNTRIRGLMGPIASGKSTGCCWEIMARAAAQKPDKDGIKRTKWAIIRNCYDDQTEVLTERRGWVLFKNLTEADKVAALKKGRMIFEKPSYYYAAPYSGEMVGLKTQTYDLLVTPEHKLWVKERRTRQRVWERIFKPMKASDAYGKGETLRMMNTAEQKGGQSDLSDDFFEFLGFWFAEGSASHIKRKDCNGYHWRLVVTQKDDDGYVSDLLERNGFSFGLCDKGNGNCNYSVNIKNDWVKALILELSQYGKARTKWIPGYIKNAPAEHLRRFIYGYKKGDGHFKGSGKKKQDSDFLYTASPSLADDLQEIVARSGAVAVKNYDPWNNSWVLTLLGESKREPGIYKNSWRKEQYNGWVYCVEVSTHVILVRRNGKQIWSMQTYRELADTTLATWLQWFPEGTAGSLNRSDMVYKIRYGQIEADVLFRALDKPGDVRKLLSLELTGGWVNEARETPKVIVDVLGDRVGRYPPTDKKAGTGPSWSGIIMDTNPPDDDHWWYNLAEVERPPGYKFLRQPGGLIEINGRFFPNPKAENLEHLEDNYYLVRMPGKSPAYIRVYYCGQYGFIVDGKPVYPEYVDAVHCAQNPIPPVSGLPVYIGIDFGLTPAALFGQRLQNGRWLWLDELVTENMGATSFAKLLAPKIREEFGNLEIRRITGDPAGDTRSEVDEATCFQILKANGIPAVPAPTNDFMVRRDAVGNALTRFIDGKPGLIISPKCKTARKGMAGGYCLKRLQVVGEERYKDMPDKVNIYSHVCEAGQYMMLGAGEGSSVIHSTDSQSSGGGFRPRRRR